MCFVAGYIVRGRIPTLLGALVASMATPLSALNPAQQISQYGHSIWRLGDGMFPGVPNAVTQTADGYLWIGTQAGLVRFDGASFVRWVPPAGAAMGGPVLSLLGGRDGSLWIGTNGGLGYLKGETYTYRPVRRVNAIAEDRSGAVWIARSRIDEDGPLCRVAPGDLRCFGKADGIPFGRQGAEALIADPDGGLWIGSVKGVCHWAPGAAAVYSLKSLEQAEGGNGVQALALEKNGSLLVAVGHTGPGAGLQMLFSGLWNEYKSRDFRGSGVSLSSMLRDRDGGLWLATESSGLIHIHDGATDTFGEADGLSSNSVQGLYEDREGSIWAVSSRGLDRFRELPVVTMGRRQGLSDDHALAVFASPTTIWVGNRTSVDFIRGAQVSALDSKILPGNSPTSILEDRLGRLWLGMDAGLSVMTGGRFHSVRAPDGQPLGVVFGLVEGNDNHIYAIVTGKPQQIYDIQDLTVVGAANVPKILTSTAFAQHREGGVWLLSTDGTLMHYRSGKFEIVASQGPPVPLARTLVNDPEGVLWSAGLNGVGRWSGGEWKLLTSRNGLTCDAIRSGIFDDRETLWLSADCGLMSIAQAELRRWIARSGTSISVRTYDIVDGAQTGVPIFQPTVSKSADGRLWFANDTTLQVVNPDRVVDNPLSPPVLIENVAADGRDYPSNSALRLPPRTRTLRIDYTALSMVAPQKVRFRYVLDGSGQGWQDAGTRRQAFYNDLPPATYRFHVIASNNSGVWNETGASLEFTVLPAWYQTAWFKLSCVLTGMIVLWILYRIRLRQLAETMNVRFNDRMAERNRLAGELHDTILQTIQASKLIADNARLEHSADPVRLREAMNSISEWLSQATTEARAALNSLRESTSQRNDLAEALQQAAEASQAMASMKFVLSVEGTARDLHPIVRDEIYRIGSEAIRNAVRHSGGTELHADLTYGHDLVLRISDNGLGMTADLATQGLPGHFGIPGMYERASRIHATLHVRSGRNAGTELELHVPRNVVYREPKSGSETAAGILRRFRRRKTP
jgi:signal transduction histidine kinase/ligand-binding sensor domain-containing protein